jgi:hypothetical protein
MKRIRNRLYLPAAVCRYIQLRHPGVTLAEGVRIAMQCWHSESRGFMGEVKLPKERGLRVEVVYHKRLKSSDVVAKVLQDAGNNGVVI